MGKAINSSGKHHSSLVIGLFGFGVVGEGVYKALQQTPSLKATIKKICIKHPGKKRKVLNRTSTTREKNWQGASMPLAITS